MPNTSKAEPYIVNPNGLPACIITAGQYKGLPLAIAYLIEQGQFYLKDVKRRGWKYGRVTK